MKNTQVCKSTFFSRNRIFYRIVKWSLYTNVCPKYKSGLLSFFTLGQQINNVCNKTKRPWELSTVKDKPQNAPTLSCLRI